MNTDITGSKSKCPCCKAIFGSDRMKHINSHKHRFHYIIWLYGIKRKGLCKDREGIRVEINLTNTENADITFNAKHGKYIVHTNLDKLIMCDKKLSFECCFHNDRKKDTLVLTQCCTLDAAPWAKVEFDKYVPINPKSHYKGSVIEFKLDKLILGSFKIPIGIAFQTFDGKQYFFCRTILVNISDDDAPLLKNVENFKSPFTDEAWEKDVKIKLTSSRKMIMNYPIPQHLSKFFKYGLTEWNGIKMDEYIELERIRDEMNSGDVSKDNYRNFFHYCLWTNEKVEVLMLRKFNMKGVKMELLPNALKLEVPGLAEKRPSLIAGDLIRIRITNDHIGYEGFIKLVENQHILITDFDKGLTDDLKDNPEIEMDVAFQLGRLPLERSHQAIDAVYNRTDFECLFFPDEFYRRNHPCQYYLQNIDYFFDQSIMSNNEQKTVVRKILSGSTVGAPYIVFGPPGTGKTVTIVEAIWQLLRRTNKSILVCAPANAACDMLTLKLLKNCSRQELLRIHSDSREKTSIPKEIIPYSNITTEDENCLHISPVNANAAKKFRVIVTTLILSGKYYGRGYAPDYVFIDEAAQAIEPETCIPISLLNNWGNVVLAGDPKQLGPNVMSKILENYGFNKSLLQRLMETQKIYGNNEHYDSDFITMLRKNFRSHPLILKIPNELFYDNKLISATREPERDPVSEFAIYPHIKNLHYCLKNGMKKKNLFRGGKAIEFCAISSKERREGRSPSYFNPAEAHMVKEYIKTLLEHEFGEDYKVKQSDIGVITPYIRQVYKIKNLLKSNHMENVEVGTTEAFQGREKRIMIISTVRAQHSLLKHDRKYNLGFVKQEQRFNVALTRAISKNIIIGCPTVLITDPNWRLLINECRNLGSYYGMPLQERTDEKMSEIVDRFARFPDPEKET